MEKNGSDSGLSPSPQPAPSFIIGRGEWIFFAFYQDMSPARSKEGCVGGNVSDNNNTKSNE